MIIAKEIRIRTENFMDYQIYLVLHSVNGETEIFLEEAPNGKYQAEQLAEAINHKLGNELIIRY